MYGGIAVDEMLHLCDLVDARFLIDLHEAGGIVPRYQSMPRAAIINSSTAWRLKIAWQETGCLPVLVLSYPWLDKHHPDRLGEQLGTVVPVLRAMLDSRSCTSEHGTVGVLWDWACLPQQPRSAEDETRFRRALYTLNSWYGHPCTHVLKLAGPHPTGAAYTNKRPYDERGWCFFESQMSGLVTDSKCLWDIQGYRGATTLAGLISECCTHRAPSLAPPRFAEEMRTRAANGKLAFTASADMETVIELYERGFVGAFDTYRSLRGRKAAQTAAIFYRNLDWQDEQARELVHAIEYMRSHCTLKEGPLEVRLGGNAFSAEAEAALLAAADGVKSLTLVGIGEWLCASCSCPNSAEASECLACQAMRH